MYIPESPPFRASAFWPLNLELPVLCNDHALVHPGPHLIQTACQLLVFLIQVFHSQLILHCYQLIQADYLFAQVLIHDFLPLILLN